MKSAVNLYLNADRTKVVLAGEEAAFLLANAGREIPDAEIERAGPGILEQARKLGAKAQPPAANKAVAAPPENKSK